jgi:hypothetical protein
MIQAYSLIVIISCYLHCRHETYDKEDLLEEIKPFEEQNAHSQVILFLLSSLSFYLYPSENGLTSFSTFSFPPQYGPEPASDKILEPKLQSPPKKYFYNFFTPNK